MATTPRTMTLEELLALPDSPLPSQLRRCHEFAAAGVTLCMVVDPDREMVSVVRRDGTVREARGAERIDLSEVLPSFEATADQLFEALSFR